MAKKESQSSTTSIATTQPATAVANTTPGRATVRALFERQSEQLSRALAGQIDTDRFIRSAMTAWSNGSPEFQQSDPVSLLGACMQAAQLGLSIDPVLGEAWLIPRRNKKRGGQFCINFQLGAKGLVKLARRSPNFRNVRTEIVSVGDHFEYIEGSTIEVKHRKQLDLKERPKLRCTYATVYYKDGGSTSYIAPMFEIFESRQRSDAFRNGYGPWVSHFESMAKIVPLRKLMRLEAIDDLVLRQLSREEAQDASDDVIEYGIDGEFALPNEELPAVIGDPQDVDALKTKFAIGKGESG